MDSRARHSRRSLDVAIGRPDGIESSVRSSLSAGRRSSPVPAFHPARKVCGPVRLVRLSSAKGRDGDVKHDRHGMASGLVTRPWGTVPRAASYALPALAGAGQARQGNQEPGHGQDSRAARRGGSGIPTTGPRRRPQGQGPDWVESTSTPPSFISAQMNFYSSVPLIPGAAPGTWGPYRSTGLHLLTRPARGLLPLPYPVLLPPHTSPSGLHSTTGPTRPTACQRARHSFTPN